MNHDEKEVNMGVIRCDKKAPACFLTSLVILQIIYGSHTQTHSQIYTHGISHRYILTGIYKF